jgi:hypothetical protein
LLFVEMFFRFIVIKKQVGNYSGRKKSTRTSSSSSS